MDLILTLSTIKAFPIDILVSGPVQIEKEHVGRRILLLSHSNNLLYCKQLKTYKLSLNHTITNNNTCQDTEDYTHKHNQH